MDSGLMVSLQKVLAGGIILIELTVQERHFFVKMYLLDYCSHHRIFRHEVSISSTCSHTGGPRMMCFCVVGVPISAGG